MAVRLAALTGNAMVDAVTTRMISGTIKVYTGSQPATGDTAVTGTLLVTLTLDSTPVASGSSGVASYSDLPLSGTPVAGGVAGYFRVFTSGGAAVVDGACGTSGSDMNMNTTTLVSGVPVTMTLASNTMPLS